MGEKNKVWDTFTTLQWKKKKFEEIYTGGLWQCRVIKSFVTKKEKKKSCQSCRDT